MNDERGRESDDHPRRMRIVPLLRDTEMPQVLRPTYEPLFESCIVCACALQEPGSPLYVIEKAVRGSEPIFEYAMCLSCMSQMREELSPESLQRLDRHFETHFPLQQRQRWVLDDAPADAFLQRCALTGTDREDCADFQVVALCSGPRLLLNEDSPFLLSGRAVEAFFHLLSRRTRDRFDDFTRDHLGLPPELRELPIVL